MFFGTSSGIHAWHNDFYLRRLRILKSESLYKYLKNTNPELLEDDMFNLLNGIVCLPQKAPEGSILRNERALDLLERMKKVYSEWILPGHNKGVNTHNVSITVSVGEDEWDEVVEWMWKNRESYSGISLLPRDNHTYKQAPFEDISKERYEELMGVLKNIDLTKVNEENDETNLTGEIACGGTRLYRNLTNRLIFP